jgi:tRNA dimethylallyltransferase
LKLHSGIVARAATVAAVNGEERGESGRAEAVLALFGPTSVGKSEVAVALAEQLAASGTGSVLIGADSMQLYEGLPLISGVASEEQRRRADHRLIGCVPIDAEFSVAQYSKLAHAEIDGAIAAGVLPIVVGGTGLYMQAALTEMPLRPQLSPGIEQALQARFEEEGAEALHAELAAQAPAAASRINVADRRRLLRALALLGEGHSIDDQAGGIWTSQMRHRTRLIGLNRERNELYERIDARVDAIAAAGGAEEVAAALAAGASRTAQMALGFRELPGGELQAMKQATRRYAKRQLTWLRKLEAAELFELGGARTAQQVAEEILATGSPAAA